MEQSPDCSAVREALQDVADHGERPQGALLEHVAGCAACARFLHFLERLGPEVNGTLRSSTSSLAPVDYEAVFVQAEQRKRAGRRLILEAVAALLLAVAGVLGALRIYSGNQDRMLVRQSVESLVNGLFSTPLLEGGEYALAEIFSSAGGDLSGLFDDLGAEMNGAEENAGVLF